MDERALARFDVKWEQDGECWRWIGARKQGGYGRFYLGKPRLAHRVSYEHFVGPIPEGLDLDHLCRHPWCVRPEHLEPVTRRENLLRGETHTARHAAATHCPQGHPYMGENLGRTKDGSRYCRECKRAKCRDWHQRNRDHALAYMQARRQRLKEAA